MMINRVSLLCRDLVLRSLLAVSAGALLVVACAVLAGCGGERSQAHLRSGTYMVGPGVRKKRIERDGVKYLPNGALTLARVRVPGGYVSLVGLYYEYMRQRYFGLREHEEEPPSSQKVGKGGGGGTSGKAGEGLPRDLAMEIEIKYGCLGPYRQAFAYGLLRNFRDTVIAEENKTFIVFKKVLIPASLHAGGATLIYAPVGWGPVRIVDMAPNGQVMSNESFPGNESTSSCSSH